MDAFSAGSNKDFSQSYMEAKNVLYYPSSYGLVLTGDMYNARDFFDSYIRANQIQILKLIGDNAKRMIVSSNLISIACCLDDQNEVEQTESVSRISDNSTLPRMAFLNSLNLG